MVELGADLRFVEEHLDDPRIVGELGAQPLDHDLLLEPGRRSRGAASARPAPARVLAREIDLGHAADGEPA